MNKIIITLLFFLPVFAYAQHDTTWKKRYRVSHSDSLHQHKTSDTLIKQWDQMEFRELGQPIQEKIGYKILLHKVPKDTVIFTDLNGNVFPKKPIWEADRDWYNKYYRHYRSKIDSL